MKRQCQGLNNEGTKCHRIATRHLMLHLHQIYDGGLSWVMVGLCKQCEAKLNK